MADLQCRPIDKWPRALTKNRQRATFTKAYGTVMSDCFYELEKMGAKSVVLLMALREQDIRLDGRPKAGSKLDHPGVILVVTTNKLGTLRFPCDTYDDWLANLRAITLHLKALRAIDRYGVSVEGEQYTGWAALPPPNGDHWNEQQAAEWLSSFIDVSIGEVLRDTRGCLLRAERKSHPDVGGNSQDFHKVQQARKLLMGN